MSFGSHSIRILKSLRTHEEVILLEYEVIWGHIDMLVVAVRSLSRSEQVKLY